MALLFPHGLYKIINAKNGDINVPLILPTVVPVIAAPEGTVWQVKPAPPENLGFNVHHLVHILKDGQPANLENKGLLPGDKGIVVLNIGATPNPQRDGAPWGIPLAAPEL
ncbi:hypothetical protein Clacol_010246 [Clathrus columnatus]|uniref:Uncharacterized protein n=1 Tax=Clathrus columnatus TaxID=1419009 RepID=A0AAV5AQ77_9AGAM|nr:hypothetical protein Clacol_010246 [Clathrus columnatus]